MARRNRNGVAVSAALVVGGLLVALELLVRETRVGATGARTPSSLVSEVVGRTTDVTVTGWAALLVPVGIVLVLGLLLEAMSGGRR